MKKAKLKKLLVYLGIISVGIFVVNTNTRTNNTSAFNFNISKKVKPLIVLDNQNRPSLNFDGTRVVAGPQIGLKEVFDVGSGKKLGSYRVKDSDAAVISKDGKIVRIFGEEYSYQTTYLIDNGKMIERKSTGCYKNGKLLKHFNVSTYGGETSRNYTSNLSIVARPYPTYTRKNIPDQPAIVVCNIDTNKIISELYYNDKYVEGDRWQHTIMTLDGKIVAAARNNRKIKNRRKTVVWNVKTGKTLLTLPFLSFWMSISADGSILVTNDSDTRTTEFWNVKTGNKISTLTEKVRGKEIPVKHGVLSPNGKVLVTSVMRRIMFWDVETGQFLTSQNQYKYSEGLVKTFGFSGDGKRLAVGSDTEVVTVWSVEDILQKTKFTNRENIGE